MKEVNKPVFETENDLRMIVKGGEEFLVDEVCCTSINIILKNDGQIMTSFLGAHNPEIVRQLERAQKAYFKEIKKTLKKKYNEPEGCGCSPECTCGDDCKCTPENHCGCGGHCNDEKEHQCSCGCEEHKHEKHEKKNDCDYHDANHDCHCHDKHEHKNDKKGCCGGKKDDCCTKQTKGKPAVKAVKESTKSTTKKQTTKKTIEKK